MTLNSRKKHHIQKVILHFFLVLISLTMLAPFYWMVITGFKTDTNVMVVPPQFFPNPISFEHYQRVLTMPQLWRSTLNSSIIAVVLMLGSLFTTSLAGFAFAKIPFTGKNKVFGLFLGTLMIPGPVMMIPLYIVFAKIGWVGTQLPLVVPGILLNVTGVFLMRQFMMGIPDSYVESARIDGCGYFGIYIKLFLPICKAILSTLALTTFIGSWNDFMGALIYLSDPKSYTLPLLLATFRVTQYEISWGSVMAVSTLIVLPTAIMFLINQKHFTQGVILSGLKS